MPSALPQPNSGIFPQPGQPSTAINPVATRLMDALNEKTVSPEEALQMMNDFVSGNQDMNKAAKNIDGMLGQISSRRHHKVESQTPSEASSTFPQFSQQLPPAMSPIPMEDEHRFIGGADLNVNSGYVNPDLPKLPSSGKLISPFTQTSVVNDQSPSTMFSNSANPSSGDPFTLTGSQRHEQHLRPDQAPGTITPNSPLPPAHLFDNPDRFGHFGDEDLLQRLPHNEHSMVMEPVSSNYDGYANPSFPKRNQNFGGPPVNFVNAPDRAAHNADVAELPDKINDTPNDNSLIHNAEMPNIEVPSTVTTDINEKLPTPPLMDANNQPVEEVGSYSTNPPPGMYPENENIGTDSPEGHVQADPTFSAGKTSMGYQGDFEEESNYARKFRTPHLKGNTGQAPSQIKHVTGQSRTLTVNSKPLSKSILIKKAPPKQETGHRKHAVLADMYADSLFPEDYSDIASLQGSLQGKTLTKFDSSEPQQLHDAGMENSRKKAKLYRTDVKATFPLEGSVIDNIDNALGK